MNVVKALVMDKPVTVIVAGESFDFAALVLKSPPVDALRHPDVQGSRPTAQDVHEIFVIFQYSTELLSS